MKWIVGTFAAAFALMAIGLFTSPGQSQPPAKDAAPKSSRTLTASGTGTVKVEADTAKITFKVEASGADLKSARQEHEKKAGKLKEALDGLKLSLDIRALPVEIQQQQNAIGFGGVVPGGPGGVPGGIAPPVFPDKPPPPAPPALDRKPLDGVFAAPVPNRPLKDAPNDQPPKADPTAPPAPPTGGGGFALPGGIGMPNVGFNVGFQLSQSYIVTFKNSDPAKLRDGANKALFTAAENGVALGSPNNFGAPGGFGIGGPIGFGGGFQGNPPAAGPRVTFLRSDDKDTRRKALELAVADAVANAKVMAKGADVTIVDTLSINDPPVSRTGQPFVDYTMGGYQAENTTGEMDVTVRVTVICSY